MPEHAAKSEKFVSRAKGFAPASGIFVILIGLVALSGWIFDIPKLKSIYGDITMKANAALALILTGAALWAINGKNNNPQRRWFAQICGSSAAVIDLLTLSEHAFGWNLRIDQLLFTEPPGSPATTSPGRMGITASFCFTVYGISLLLLYRRFAIRFAQVVSIIAGSWALLAVIGYAYQAEALFGISRYTGIAFPTAVALFVLCLGILATCVEEGMLSIVCDETAAGIMVRRLGLVTAFVPTESYSCLGLREPDDLSGIQQPVLVANGDSDKMVPSCNSVDLARRLPKAEIVLYPDAGHSGIFQYHQAFVKKSSFSNHENL